MADRHTLSNRVGYVLAAGVTVSYVSLQTAFEIFGSVVAVFAITVAVEAWRTRRGEHRSTAELAGLDPSTKSDR